MKEKHPLLISLAALAILLAGLFFSTEKMQAQTETVLYSFPGGRHGNTPAGGLVEDSKGRFYGTTVDGGLLSACGGFGCGVVYKVSPTGVESVLQRFTGGADGANPRGDLVRSASGNLYGTKQFGGSGNLCYEGCGTVFEVTPLGAVTVLYSFTGLKDGGNSAAGLIKDANGNLYGTTVNGGGFGWGAVFKITPAGKETVLHSFSGGTDGASPYAGLIMDANGNIYGTTSGTQSGYGDVNGNVFKLTPTGTETVLYTFSGGADGANPVAGLVEDANGNLYGTTEYGGDLSLCSGFGCGVAFEITAAGTYTVLHRFGAGTDGRLPLAGLVVDAAGNLYGTTNLGGTSFSGTVFEITPSGTESLLYSFTGGVDGAFPFAGLLRDAKGNLYGTTFGGGALGNGTVFKLVP